MLKSTPKRQLLARCHHAMKSQWHKYIMSFTKFGRLRWNLLEILFIDSGYVVFASLFLLMLYAVIITSITGDFSSITQGIKVLSETNYQGAENFVHDPLGTGRSLMGVFSIFFLKIIVLLGLLLMLDLSSRALVWRYINKSLKGYWKLFLMNLFTSCVFILLAIISYIFVKKEVLPKLFILLFIFYLYIVTFQRAFFNVSCLNCSKSGNSRCGLLGQIWMHFKSSIIRFIFLVPFLGFSALTCITAFVVMGLLSLVLPQLLAGALIFLMLLIFITWLRVYFREVFSHD